MDQGDGAGFSCGGFADDANKKLRSRREEDLLTAPQ